MAGRGRVPSYMILLVVAFALVGLVGFQTLKERKTAYALLLEKENEIDRLKLQCQDCQSSILDGFTGISWKDVQSSKKKLAKITEEKEKLSHQVIELEHFKHSFEDSLKLLTTCREEKGQHKQLSKEKANEVIALRERLKEQQSKISKVNEQLAQAKGKLQPAEQQNTFSEVEEVTDGKERGTTISKDKTLGGEDQEQQKDDISETAMEVSDKVLASEEQEKDRKEVDHGEGIKDDRSEEYTGDSKADADLEDSKVDADLEDSKTNADLDESELAATKDGGADEDEAQELETDVKLAVDAALESNDHLAQE